MLVLLAALLSCSKKGGNGPVAPSTSATATVMGITLGNNGGGLPLANVTVSSNPSAGVTATSNSFGFFSLKVPANVPVAITASHVGFALHPLSLQLATGDSRAVTFVLAAFGGTGSLAVSSGGKVADLGAKTAITLPGDFTTGTSFATVNVTGVDPTTDQALAMPASLLAENSFGTLLDLEPATAAEVRIGDGFGNDFPLVQPAVLEMHLPAAKAADVMYGLGNLVPCFEYDAASNHWKFLANGSVAISSVDGQKCVKVTITHLSWFAAGFLNGSTGCVSGHVYNGVTPVGGATVQAFPGSLGFTAADGSYRVNAPADAPVQIVATRPGTGTVTFGSASTTAGSPAGSCTDQSVSLGAAAPPSTFLVSAQLLHGRDGLFVRDEVIVSVQAATSPSPTPLSGCVVQLADGLTTYTVPLASPGLYESITGQAGAIQLQAGHVYTLRIDFEPDGHFDASATAIMPGQPTILAPASMEIVNPSFTASWMDPATATVDSVVYIGSCTSNAFGLVPSVFAVHAPAASYAVGTGIGQPQYSMPNDSLSVSGAYTFRLWATNGPVRYPVGGTQAFSTPNIAATTAGATNVVGWFSAVSIADSVVFASFGTGTRPHLAVRAPDPSR